jgi:hypothetical protein
MQTPLRCSRGRGVVDLLGTLGAYQLVAIVRVVDHFPLPDGVALERR